MKNIKKYNHYVINEESSLENLKRGVSKLSNKLSNLTKGKKRKAAQKEDIENAYEVLSDSDANYLIVSTYKFIMRKSPEFPNDTKRFTFLRGIITYAQLYDSIVDATRKEEDEEGFLHYKDANKLIFNLRKIVKRHLDVDLESGYKYMESNTHNDFIRLEKDLYSEYRINEEIMGTLRKAKDKVMDFTFGKEKDDGIELKGSRQYAKLKKYKGLRNMKSITMSDIDSNAIPKILVKLGAALGMLGWLAKTEWMKDLIMNYFSNPEEVTAKFESLEQIELDGGSYNPNGLVAWMEDINVAEGAGEINTGQDVLDFIDKYGKENMSGFFEGNGGGDPKLQVETMYDLVSSNPDARVEDIFTKAAGTFGHKAGTIFSISRSAVLCLTRIKKVTHSYTYVTDPGAVVGAGVASKVAGIGSILSSIGIALVVSGAVVKLLKEKAKRSSRAALLNTLLQSMVSVSANIPNLDNKKEDEDDDIFYYLFDHMVNTLKDLHFILKNYQSVDLDRSIEIRNSRLSSIKEKKLNNNLVTNFDSFVLEKGEIKDVDITMNKRPNNPSVLKDRFDILLESISYLLDKNNKGVSVNAEFLEGLILDNYENNQDLKETIITLFKNIYNIYKGFVSGKYSDDRFKFNRSLYENKSMEILKTESNSVAEKIVGFHIRWDEDLDKELHTILVPSDFGSNLFGFHGNMSFIIQYVDREK